MRFLLASGNRNKLREFGGILAPHTVLAMSAGVSLPPEGLVSFEQNALGKARGLARALLADARLLAQVGGPPLLCLADDSGLEVEALGWAPGVTSSRYAGEDADDEMNWRKLLSQLEGYSDAQRRARFTCVVAAVPLRAPSAKGTAGAAGVSSPPALEEYVAHGRWWGTIVREPRGDSGFGYDPVFLPDGSALTVAQLSPEEKERRSHRALAAKALLELLEREGLLEA